MPVLLLHQSFQASYLSGVTRLLRIARPESSSLILSLLIKVIAILHIINDFFTSTHQLLGIGIQTLAGRSAQ